MPLIVVGSPKGGVGKTTLTANLAIALQRTGRQVTAVDLDAQNALRFLLLPDARPGTGIAGCVARGLPWQDCVQISNAGVKVATYGHTGAAGRLRLKQILSGHQISEALASLAQSDTDIIIVDTAPGEGRIQERLAPIADLELIVLLADAGSMSLLPDYRGGLLLRRAGEGSARTFGVLNQVDPRRRLSRDIDDFVSEHVQGRFIGKVHYDEALAEAAACGLPVVQAAPDSLAARDIRALAERIGAFFHSPAQAEAGHEHAGGAW